MGAPAGMELLSEGSWNPGSVSGEWSPGGCGCGSGSCSCGGSCGCKGDGGGSCGGGKSLGEVALLPDYDGEVWARRPRASHSGGAVVLSQTAAVAPSRGGPEYCTDTSGQRVSGTPVPCSSPPPAGFPPHCAALRKCLMVNEVEVECGAFCTVNGKKTWGVLCEGKVWTSGASEGVPCQTTTATPNETPAPCKNSCSVTLYDGTGAIPPKHRPLVRDALKKRANSPDPGVFSVLGGTKTAPIFEPGYQNPGWWWHQGQPSGLGRSELAPWVVVAVLEYTCPCGPSARLDWFMKDEDGQGDTEWQLDPSPHSLAGYTNFMNAITQTGRGEGADKDLCFMAISDTPTKRTGQWLAVGRVTWAQEGPRECQDQAVFTRKSSRRGGSKRVGDPDKIMGGLPPMSGTGRVLGGGDP